MRIKKPENYKELFINDDKYTDMDDDLYADEKTDYCRFVQAIDESTKEIVTVKVFKPTLFQEDAQTNSPAKCDYCWYRQLMLLREATILKQTFHPTIVEFKGMNLYNSKIVFDEDEKKVKKDYSSPTIFLGKLNSSLHHHIQDKKLNISAVERQICMLGIAAGVRFLHNRAIIHRKLNPKSIWLDDYHHPKICDLSTSREYRNDAITNLFESSDLIIYQAPEILDHKCTSYGYEVDVFALGRLFYLLITGYEPFKYKNDPIKRISSDLLEVKIRDENVKPKFPDEVSTKFQNFLNNCWDKEPQKRPKSSDIYDFLRNEEWFRIDGISDEDFQKYEKYKESIEKFDIECLEGFLSSPHTFQIQSNPSILAEGHDNVTLLLNIISSNFAILQEDDICELINKMADDQTIFKENCLPQVISFVNFLIRKGNSKANDFLNKVFGECIVPNNSKEGKDDEINAGSYKDDYVSINIPPNIKVIRKKAFEKFTKLTRVYIPDSVTVIEDEAFSRCINLKFVNIPEFIKGENFGKCVFENCENLEYIQVPPINTINEKTFYNNLKLKVVNLSDGIKTIGEQSFYGCKSLLHIDIPGTVTHINLKAFKKSGLKVIAYKGIQKPNIGKWAIPSGCKSIP